MKMSATWSLLATGLLLASPALAQDIEIGIIAPTSGPAATYGKDLMNAVNLAVDEINAAGGVTGRKLVAVVGDDRASPKDAANVAQTFVSNPKMLAMIGGVTSTATFGAAPVAQKGKLPFVMTLASHPDLTKEGDYIFRNSVTQEQEGPALARMVSTCLAPKTVAIMYLNNDWGLSMTGEFKRALDPAKVKIVAEESYDPGENIDYSAKLAKIKAANPDVVWFGSQYNDLALILKQAQRVNLAGKPFVAIDGGEFARPDRSRRCGREQRLPACAVFDGVARSERQNLRAEVRGQIQARARYRGGADLRGDPYCRARDRGRRSNARDAAEGAGQHEALRRPRQQHLIRSADARSQGQGLHPAGREGQGVRVVGRLPSQAGSVGRRFSEAGPDRWNS